MAAARMFGAPCRTAGIQGARTTGAGESGSGHHAERDRGTCVETACQTRRGRRDPQPARLRISIGRSEIVVTASISRRLILWLAVPLMLLALCGALVHYFNKVAPGVISSDRRLREAANALMVRTKVLNSQWSLDDRADSRPPLPSADSVVYALRDAQGRLLIGDSRLPVVSLDSATSQLFSMSQFEHRYLRTLSTRFETVAGVVIVTVADAHSAEQPAARYGMMSTLLWDFVQ